jgi:EAL domain-containing protein (putative c-di-GMP-specific phosphodiesterase class I)
MDVNAEIRRLVKKYEVDPAKLRIEITESVMMDDVDNRMDILKQFREEGFIVEMDDFGSGFSSLNMLKDMPVDVLKIDMNFLGKTTDDERSNTIVQNIINLTHDLKIESLTEGVETENQYKALAQMGCRLFQGYYFAKPMPIEEFMSFYSAN